MFYCVLPQHFLSSNILSIRVPRVRKNCLPFRRNLPVSLLFAMYFLSNGCEKLLDVVPSANYLCTHLTEQNQLSNYQASLTARFKQILIRLNKFRIVITKRVVVIIRCLGKWVFHIMWHQRHKHTTHFGVLQVGSPKKVIVCLTLEHSESYLSVGNHVSRRTDEYAEPADRRYISHTNFKKLG